MNGLRDRIRTAGGSGAAAGKDGAASSSPPPCGEGLGVGVAQCGTSVPLGTTPHPSPPPREVGFTRLRHQTGSKSDRSDFDWGRESPAARPKLYSPAVGGE